MRHFVIIFFDDKLVYSFTLSEHVHRLEIVFTLLTESQFYLKQSKCAFCQQSIKYLGHIISASKVALDPVKIQAMVEWPVPQSVKALCGFLGLIGIYYRFIRGYTTTAGPLTALLKKDEFH